MTAKSIELEKSLCLTCQIFGMLVNTLAADEKYPVLNRENLTGPIQKQLYQKKKLFLNFTISSWIFEIYLKF